MTGAARHKILGVCPAARAAVLADAMRAHPSGVWVVVAPDLKVAEQLAEDTLFFLGASGSRLEALVFPESIPDSRDMREAFAASGDRLTVLSKLREAKSGHRRPGAHQTLAVFATPSALLQPVPAIEKYAASEVVLVKGSRQPFQALLQRLRDLDYDSEAVCESPGHYAIRGGIIDVYPVTATEPYRLDFFGDDIEDIRAFDPVTQRSGASVVQISVAASPRVRLEAAKTGIADYLDPQAHIAFVEPAALEEEFRAFAAEGTDGLAPLLAKCAAAFGIAELDEESSIFNDSGAEVVWDTESLEHHRRLASESLLARDRLQAEEDARRAFLGQLTTWKREGYAIVFAASKEGEEKRMREILAADPSLSGLDPLFLKGSLNEGFRVTARRDADLALSRGRRGLVFVTETEVFGRKRARRLSGTARARVSVAQVDQLLDFSELVEGDFVVHLQHGIALYRGVTKLDTAQGVREVISLEFDDGVTLHVPLQESHLISRYVGLGRTKPQLGRIGTARWEKARRAVERATVDLAAELLRIQASREAQEGFAFPADTEWQGEFEASFPFTETKGQLQAIEEVKRDMERKRPMDRLICGDVGFGKTEVALRAAFVTAMSGSQVAVVVPTTLLSRQHFRTFSERFQGLPVTVAQLSRMVTAKEAAEVRRGLADGSINIVIGTHALLAKGTIFSALGLLVVDEEQHFGVAHKEKLKALKADVHVLTLTATPIPRTLQLALTGVREMSLIATPPVDRLAVRTFIMPFDSVVIREALQRERFRGGQVFCVVPRIEDLGRMAERLAEIVPEACTVQAHGRLAPTELERVMTEFGDGKYDILLSTNIVESGLDMPAVNTLLIHRADMFGLGQLYQLRGRVGRGKQRGYAYLTWPQTHRISAAAEKRLTVMHSLDALGAGFTLASHDLDIRGAGNLLGDEQSGHIREVGIELYQQMLEDAVAEMRAEKGRRRADDRDWTPNIGLGLPVLIPDTYVPDLPARLGLYRRIGNLASDAETEAMAAELVDRFGKLPEEVENLLAVVALKRACREAGVEKLDAGPKGMVIGFRGNAFRNPAGLVSWLTSKGGTIRLRPDHKLAIGREMNVAERVRVARDVVANLNRIAAQAKAA